MFKFNIVSTTNSKQNFIIYEIYIITVNIVGILKIVYKHFIIMKYTMLLKKHNKIKYNELMQMKRGSF